MHITNSSHHCCLPWFVASDLEDPLRTLSSCSNCSNCKLPTGLTKNHTVVDAVNPSSLSRREIVPYLHPMTSRVPTFGTAPVDLVLQFRSSVPFPRGGRLPLLKSAIKAERNDYIIRGHQACSSGGTRITREGNWGQPCLQERSVRGNKPAGEGS